MSVCVSDCPLCAGLSKENGDLSGFYLNRVMGN